MQELLDYQDIDPEISQTTAKKFSNHLWYLGSENVALFIFDDNVPEKMKRNMAKAILKTSQDDEEDNQVKRYILNPKD